MAGRRKGRPPRSSKHLKRTGRHHEGPKSIKEGLYANLLPHCRSHGQVYAYILVAFLFLQHQHVIQLFVLACISCFEYLQRPSGSGNLPYILQPAPSWHLSFKNVFVLVASDVGYGAAAVLSCMYLPCHSETLSDPYQVILECLIIKTIANSQTTNDILRHSHRLRILYSTIASHHLGKSRAFRQNTLSFANGVASAYKEAYIIPIEDRRGLRGLEGSPFVIQCLGLGGSSEVYAVILPSGRMVASKGVYVQAGDLDSEDRRLLYTEALQNEAWIMRKLTHPHLPSFVDMVDDKLYFLPVAQNDLQQYFETNCSSGHYQWVFRKRMMPWLGCLSSALRYLHRQGVRHNDLKSSNVLVDGDRVWIIDFGTAIDTIAAGTDVSSGQARAKTELYAAPEVLKGIKWGFPADIFALGCIYLEIFTVMCDKQLKYLQKARTRKGGDVRYAEKIDWIIRNWLPSLYPPPQLDFESSQTAEFMAVKDFVTRMLHPDPRYRPTAEELTFGPSFQRKCCNCPHRKRLPDAPEAFSGPIQEVYLPRLRGRSERSESSLFCEIVLPHDLRRQIANQPGLTLRTSQMQRQVSSSSTLRSEFSLSIPPFSSDPASGSTTPRTSLNPSSPDLAHLLGGEASLRDVPTLYLSPEDTTPSRPPSDATQIQQFVDNTQPYPESWNALEPHIAPTDERKLYLSRALDDLGPPQATLSRVLTQSSDGSSTVRDLFVDRSRSPREESTSFHALPAEVQV